MALTASSLVQETVRADRAGLNAGRAGVQTVPADAFAQMLQSRTAPGATEVAGPLPSAGRAPSPPPAEPAPQAATESASVSASTAAAVATPDSAARETAQGAPAEPARPGGPAGRGAARPTGSSAGRAATPADDPTVSEPRDRDTASQSSTAPAGADSLAQWLMQIGVIPALAGATPATVAAERAEGAEGAQAGQDPMPDALSGLRRTVFRLPGDDAQALSVGRAAADLRDALREQTGARTGEPADEQAGLGTDAGAIRLTEAVSAQAAAALPAERFGERLLEEAGRLASAEAGPTLDAAGLAAWSAAPAPAAAGPDMAPTPVEATLQQPFDEPEARAELLLQVGRFVREGVGEARLHLNPAEMGPIQIHIAMDGNAARIDFVAAQAATRELLQSSLAALAESLGADGLTLVDSQVHAEAPRGAAGDSGGAQASASGGSGAGAGFGRGDAGEGRGRSGTPPVSGSAAGRAGAAQGAAVVPASARPPAAPGARALDLYA